jgi:HEAT repeat protein
VKKSFDELLTDLRTSNSEKVRYNAARILGEMGDSKAVEPLIDVLKHDKNGSVRLYAARALGELGDSAATIHLIESLREDRNVDVRVRAARALGRLGGAIVVEPLVESLNDENPQVRINTIEALMDYETDEAISLIKNMLFDKDEEVQRNAVIAMYNVTGESILKEILEKKEYSLACKEEAQNILDEEFDKDE